ncbi:MAG: DUF354 domain-containing protein [Bacteroidales bacterium]|nr:DUF354 domain-containing protein [Bacteroidales bacterium]
MNHKTRIWIDITNTPHVNVLQPIIKRLNKDCELIITARNFSETVPLLRKIGIEPRVIGRYMGESRLMKVFGMLSRMLVLYFTLPKFDAAFSLGGNYTSFVSYLRRKKSIVFSDNDISFKYFSFRFGTYFVFPSYFNSESVEKKYKVSTNNILKFNGFKENIYIADYAPDPSFLNQLPFKEFITIRPENLKASYVPKNSTSIVMQLFEKLKNENILFLPRYPEEIKYADGYDNIYIPDHPLRGLDVCYYTKAMLTGAGTFAREAALMGKPSVSFFPGKQFLTVDEIMIEKKWMLKSRKIDEIYEYLNTTKTQKRSNNHAEVLNEVINYIYKVIRN